MSNIVSLSLARCITSGYPERFSCLLAFFAGIWLSRWRFILLIVYTGYVAQRLGVYGVSSLIPTP